MDKVKLTQEQKNRIDFILSDWEPLDNSTIEEVLLRTHEQGWKEIRNRCLNDLSLDSFARVLYTPNSYYIIPEFFEGDWATRIINNGYPHNEGRVFKIAKVKDGHAWEEDIDIAHKLENIRHSTPEEIANQFWSELNRKVGEWREGDVVSMDDDSEEITYLEQEEINECLVSFPYEGNERPFSRIRMVIPVEQRLDI